MQHQQQGGTHEGACVTFHTRIAEKKLDSGISRASRSTSSRCCMILLLLGLIGEAHSYRLHRQSVVGLRPSHASRARPAHAALRGPSAMLGRFAAEALRNMQKNMSKPVKMKQFEFAARGTHHSLVESPGITDYMTLPVEEYALYDSTLMRRVSSDIFELSLPLPPSSGLGLQPTLRVRVLPAVNDTIEISSISARLTQDADAIADALTGATGELSPAQPTGTSNGASADDSARAGADARAAHAASSTMGKIARSVELAFNTTLRWKSSTTIESATSISVETSARFSVELPPPFTMAPTPLVTGAANRVMRSVIELILPQFTKLLVSDYERWRNGTRDVTVSVGSLMSEAERDTAGVEQIQHDASRIAQEARV